MKKNIIIGLLVLVAALIAWPQVQRYRVAKAWDAYEAAEHAAYMKMICTDLDKEGVSWERLNKCKDWKPGK